MFIRKISCLLFILFWLPVTFQSCVKKDEVPDGTCFDGIKNQTEDGVDCGGNCFIQCPASMSAKINGNSWKADTIKSSFTAGSLTLSIKGNLTNTFYPLVQLVYVGSLTPGSYSLNNSTSYVASITFFVTFNSGTINLTTVDTRNKLLSGSFNFICTDTSSSTTYTITDGVFENVKY